MKYLLDTDHISFLQRSSGREFTNLAARIARHSVEDFALSIVSFHEQVIGSHSYIIRARTSNELIRGYNLLLETLQGFSFAPVLPFDAEASRIFDEMRRQKVRVATMDLRIAAIALSKNLVLLTRNTSDFNNVPELDVEDWTVQTQQR